jgi:hypothetical protein
MTNKLAALIQGAPYSIDNKCCQNLEVSERQAFVPIQLSYDSFTKNYQLTSSGCAAGTPYVSAHSRTAGRRRSAPAQDRPVRDRVRDDDGEHGNTGARQCSRDVVPSAEGIVLRCLTRRPRPSCAASSSAAQTVAPVAGLRNNATGETCSISLTTKHLSILHFTWFTCT